MRESEVQEARGVDSWGIATGHWGTDGQWYETPESTRAALRRAMGGSADDPQPPAGSPSWTVPAGWGEDLTSPCHLVLERGTDAGIIAALPPDLPIGRHRLAPIDGGPHTTLIVRPRRCTPPPERAAALAVQAYAARSEGSWGIGDLRDLRMLGTWAAGQGIDLLALSPLHAPSLGTHPQSSPYYPSSRRFLNPLHLCIEEIAGAAHDDVVGRLAEEGRGLLADRRIDRAAVWAAKRPALERLFDARGTAIDTEVEEFRARGGRDLQRFATYCAIAEKHEGPWPGWPAELRHPEHPAVARFATDNSDRVRFHCWLQWLANRQLDELGNAIPFVSDLAVGVDPGGADAWSDQDLLALDARVGAPPDDFAAEGQDWGLPPYIPHLLRDAGYEPFARTLRANLHAGGGIRIDHVLGLFRLYWIPVDGDPLMGAYVRSFAQDLLAILAIESVRTGAFVIGEDLGTVEQGMRDQLTANGVLGTKLLYFEDEPPSEWQSQAMGAVTTHDLPTIAGTWTGADARMRQESGLPDDDTGRLRSTIESVVDGADLETSEVIEGAHRAIGASPVDVATANIDDVLCVEERPNMPGTVDEWPNWSISLPTTLDELTAGDAPDTLRALVEGRDRRG